MNNNLQLANTNGLEIAIIGMVGRFPGAKNLDEFWQNLRDGVESISFFTDEELASVDIAPDVLSDPNYVKANGLLQDADLFDASLFGFNPKEADVMDPQKRIFLESTYEALESAGYNGEAYKGSIGVFAGSSPNSYLLNLYSHQDIVASVGDYQISIGNDADFLSTRVSYKLNLDGPSYTVQTACSTSLVAVHLACQSLLSGECDIALAGGVSISSSQKVGYFYQPESILSPDGHCRAFDAKAQGTVNGDGVGIVVLKRLEEALADGDTIHAVIKGSAINNDGSLKVSYTAPSIEGQAKVIRAAQAMAGIQPDTISYIEAHGTGTVLGDPIEIAALTKVFRTSTQKQGFCAVGSVKTNIGHLDVAAGIASLIKTVLALKHQQIPPSLHFEMPNPQIDFTNSPFYVNNRLSEWNVNSTARRAGVSSFGIGGTNAHVILEEAPAVERHISLESRPWQLLLLSAQTSSALEKATANLANYLKQHSELNLADVAYTLQVGRKVYPHRRVVVCQNLQDGIKILESPNSQGVLTSYQEKSDRPVVFMFPGQGAQYINMALELYQTPLFREQVDRCAKLLEPHLGLDIRQILYPTEAQATEAAQQLKQTWITQPALFVIEYAISQLWIAWGVSPVAAIGHSIGEYVAATLCGVFALEDALALIAIRGRMMQELPNGAMLSVELSPEELQPLLGQELSLAAHNAPFFSVVSGATEAIDALQNQLSHKGISCRQLHTSHAFHSYMMDAIAEPFAAVLQKIKLHPPQLPFISNVSGTWITKAEATDPNYWVRHLRQPVMLSKGMAELLKQPEQILLEVGPGRTLSSLAQQHQVQQLVALTSIRHPQEQESDMVFLLKTVGQIWLSGASVDWNAFFAQQQRHRIPLPTYPFERQRHWIEPKSLARSVTKDQQLLQKKSNVADWFYIPCWKESIPLQPSGELWQEQNLCCLIFVDACGVGAELAKRLQQQNQNVITVIAAEQFSKLGEDIYAINPQKQDDYDALLQALRHQDLIPEAIAHLWSITPDEEVQSGSKFFNECQNLGFYSLLFLAQALAKQNLTAPLKLMVVTNHLHDVTGNEKLCPEKATVLSPCKVIPQEYPNITCFSLDVVIPESGALPAEKLLNQLVAEFTGEPIDLVVAYRGNHRWVQTFEPIKLEKAIAGKTKLRKGGVYLITGGLGGIGLVIAEYLAQKWQAKLILIGRSGLPEREQWEQWLATHDEQNSVSHKLRKIKVLEDLGAEVLLLSADVANEQQMQKAIAKATERFGEIHGVIHAAAHTTSATDIIQEISQDECELQFQSKVYGLYVLEKLFQGKNIDFCILMSSLASVLGGLGFISYAAANNFMDALTCKHNQTNSSPWLSVNWDGWQLREEQLNAAIGKTVAQFAMTANEGLEALERMLTIGELAQVAVSTGNLQARMRQWLQRELLVVTETSATTENLGSHHPRPNLNNAYVSFRNDAEKIIARIWQELLGVEQIGIHDNFFELGGDSLLATQVISRVRKVLQVNLSLHLFFQMPTVASIAAKVLQERDESADSSVNTIPRTTIGETEELLAQINQISDGEVDSLLSNLLAEEVY
jgi:acyl transferase domain-containing protein/acyl carrier protein